MKIMKPQSNRRYELTLCEVCGEALSKGDPGSIFFVQDIVGWHFKDAYVPLHDDKCRLDWFTTYRVQRWTLDTRIEDVI